jgi:hypothetical protein
VIALSMLIALTMWVGLGVIIWRWIYRRARLSRVTSVALGGLFFAAWMIGPILDEWLGSREFERLCLELPDTVFHGPISIGPGPFFDEAGAPRWKTDEQFAAIKREAGTWEKMIGTQRQIDGVTVRPMPITRSKTVYFGWSDKRPIVETFHLASPGGWLRRVTGWSDQSSYRCSSRGGFPDDRSMIRFAERNSQ